ncbi:cyclase family protein [Pelagibius sp. Alg239-R121]|uniref:cyclase family protein n=1 Tax=Pelagibius sp. Alg239-R121 TaxID=2993448 RepID=UPI0024A65376|nr:cyclase family protein [Pelagibius sp. Alg239-R121]
MKKLCLFVAFSACAVLASANLQAEQLKQPLAATQAIDLTQKMHEGMPFWPGGVPFTMHRLVDYDQGYQLHKFEVGENTGTHVDAPSHFIKGKQSIDQIPLSNLIVPAVMIDIQDKVTGNPDYELTPSDIEAWEAANGKIPANALVVLNTGWHKRFSDSERYINMDDSKVMHFPGYHPDSAKLLLERDVAGVGIDTLSLDFGGSKTFAFHVAMLKANKYQIENMGNLDALPATGATVVVGVLPVQGGSQAQARIIALLP